MFASHIFTESMYTCYRRPLPVWRNRLIVLAATKPQNNVEFRLGQIVVNIESNGQIVNQLLPFVNDSAVSRGL